MAVRLTIIEIGDPSSEYVRTLLQDRIVIGRSRSCDICLPDMAISTRHAEIRLKGTEYVLTDLESLNGSYVNDKPVQPFQSRKLHSGDIIRAAGFTIRVALGVAPGPDEPRDASVRHAREMLSRLSERAGAVTELRTFAVVGGPCRGMRLSLHPSKGRAVIGRGSDSDLVLEDRDVSRSHAEIVLSGGAVTVRDLGSKNGVIFHDARVPSVQLDFGDTVAVGKSTLLLEHPSESLLGSIFEAPEEETSSFSPASTSSREDISPETHFPSAEDPFLEQTHPLESTPLPKSPSAPESALPVGPEDPLIPETAQSEPLQEPASPPQAGTDLGLIIIGVILLAAAVAGLAYLFH